jgi:flavorubredoxin
MITLFDNVHSKSVMFHDLGSGLMVQSNQHVIIKNNQGMVLDPGGHKIYTKLFAQLTPLFPIQNIRTVFFSHQDPDIIAAANGWLMVTDADAYIPSIWYRFLPHFGIDKFVEDRIIPIPDEGMKIEFAGEELIFIPAHFLHSAGNVMVYDPSTKILYSGDLGASLGAPYTEVGSFEEHHQYIDGFHSRYIPSSVPLKMFVNTVKDLDIDIIAPQHGAIYRGKETIDKFLNYLENLKCGFELMGDRFNIPE